MSIAEAKKTAAETWDRLASTPRELRLRYWDSPSLRKLVRERFLEETGGNTVRDVITRHTGRNHFKTAISIGCGQASEEIWLLEHKFVDHFVLCDFSAVQLELARKAAEARGIDPSRITFTNEVHTDRPFGRKLDLVYWRSSLHHMLDTAEAVKWSADAVRGDGVVYCNDYCGPNRMQWPDEMLSWAQKVRQALPPSYLRNPHDPDTSLGTQVYRQSVDYWMQIDPTECADSENIIPALKKYLPQTHIYYLGGAVYHLALNDIIHNFSDTELDESLLRFCMTVDALLASRGLNHFFVSVSDIR
jgi:SAM-dependent methyltransferase